MNAKNLFKAEEGAYQENFSQKFYQKLPFGGVCFYTVLYVKKHIKHERPVNVS